VKMGEYQSLYLPPAVLWVILFVFASGMGYLVYRLFKMLNDKDAKKKAKADKKSDVKGKKVSAKKSE